MSLCEHGVGVFHVKIDKKKQLCNQFNRLFSLNTNNSQINATYILYKGMQNTIVIYFCTDNYIFFSEFSVAQQRRSKSVSSSSSSSSASVSQVVEFDCPEEFGYYPHPTDCTQYYVCVFGGALLESCTGGLMYR